MYYNISRGIYLLFIIVTLGAEFIPQNVGGAIGINLKMDEYVLFEKLITGLYLWKDPEI